MKRKISITVNEKLLRDVDSTVDNIFIRNRSQAIEYLLKEAVKETKIAVILGGDSNLKKGKIRNRYALKIKGITVIERIIKKLHDSGFKSVYVIADHETLTNIFKIVGDGSDYNIKIDFIDEEVQEGTASALRLIKGKIKKTFLLVHCDVLLDNIEITELWKQHLNGKMIATLMVSSPNLKTNKIPPGYLRLEGNKISFFVEKQDARKIGSSMFSRGTCVIEPEIFRFHGKSLELDVYPELARRGLLGGQISSEDHLHIHTHEDLSDVRRKIAAL